MFFFWTLLYHITIYEKRKNRFLISNTHNRLFFLCLSSSSSHNTLFSRIKILNFFIFGGSSNRAFLFFFIFFVDIHQLINIVNTSHTSFSLSIYRKKMFDPLLPHHGFSLLLFFFLFVFIFIFFALNCHDFSIFFEHMFCLI